MTRGFFAVGIYGGKTPANLGTLWRTAHSYGAALVFTVGKRYERQASDTCNTPAHIPLIHYSDINDLVEHLPHGCPLVGVELDPRATPLGAYQHRLQAAYLLGAEDNGLPAKVLGRCHDLIVIESARSWSLNVAITGGIVLHHRLHQFAARRSLATAGAA